MGQTIPCCTTSSEIYTLSTYGDTVRLKAALKEDTFKIGLKYVDQEGRTALIRAIQNGHYDCSKMLLKAKANVNGRVSY